MFSTRAPKASTRSRRSGRASPRASTITAPEGIARRGMGQRRAPPDRRSTKQLIFPIDELIAFVSAVMTLLPGDIISTGTPAWPSLVRCKWGDSVTIKVAGVGESGPTEFNSRGLTL